MRRLEVPPGGIVHPVSLRPAVQRASLLLGDALLGLAAFGSWARGEAADGSDLDLLIAIRDDVPLAPVLYRAWDEAPAPQPPASDLGRRIEPHFVHLLADAEQASGLWAEVAIDGIVLFEVGLQLSLLLVQIRRQIVTGRLVRHVAHGQPYWVRNEVA